HAHPHRQLADTQLADPVHAARFHDVESAQRLFDDLFALLFGQGDVGFIAQSDYGPAFIVIADPALETGEGAGGLVTEAIAQGIDADRGIRKLETFHRSTAP